MAAERNLMTDDLLRQIIAVGRVDLLVGAPRIEHPDETPELVRAVRACFRTHFARLRTALLHVDQPEKPDVPTLVNRFWDEEAPRGGLRSTHLMTTSVPPGDPDPDHLATRIMLAAADLLQARAVVVLDPDAGDLTVDRIAKLAAPIQEQAIDLLAPVHPRPADAGLLVTQLLRPLTRAIYGRDLREPLVPEFGASRRFVEHCAQLDFEVDRGRWHTQYWIAAEALAGRFGVRQLALGPRRTSVSRARAGLRAVFQQVITAAFLSIEATADGWRNASPAGGDPLPDLDDQVGPGESVEAAPLLEGFEQDVRNLDEILRRILLPDTHLALKAAAASRDPGPGMPAALWADVVGQFLIAHHHHVILRDHTVQALLPLYLARSGTFLREHASSNPVVVEAAVQELCGHFDLIKPRIVERWAQPAMR